MKKRLFSNNKGNSLIELIMVMMLLALFGVTIYTLIYSGSRTQQKIHQDKTSQVDARIGLNYVDVKLRQNDAQGKIEIVVNPMTGENAILIKERTFGEEYDTWIYFYNGELLEFLGYPDETPMYDYSWVIVEADNFLVSENPDTGIITNTIVYQYDGKQKEMSTMVYLKSSGVE